MTSMPSRPEQLLSVARAFRPTPSAAGGLHFASDLAGVVQTYRLPGPGRFPVRQAPSQDRMLPVAETPAGLLVRHDKGGAETWQLSLLGGDGELQPLTRDQDAIHRDVVVAPDRCRAGLAYNPGGRSDWVLGVIDLATGEIEPWVDEGGYWSWLGWSSDGRVAAVAEYQHLLRNRGFLVDGPGRMRRFLSGSDLVIEARWAGDRLLALTDLDRDFVGLVEVDRDDPDCIRRRLIDEEHDVLALVPDPWGRRAAVVVNEGPYDSVRTLDLERGAELWRARLPAGIVYFDNTSRPSDHLAWSPDGSHLFVAWDSATAPADIYELPSGTRWTWAGGDAIPGLVAPHEVRFRSFDGLEIPGLHFGGSGRERPTVVWFHGGPEGQARAGFNPAIAMWNAAGFDVLAPNVRGSTGYGRRYHSLDDRELRWDAVRDGCEAGRWLRREGASRLIAMGQSYGGFMTLAVLVEEPTLWDAGIDIVGIGDWHSFFANTSGWRRAVRAAEYGDPAGPDAEFLAEFSPLRRADRIRAPLLVIHGRNDVRVPLSEAHQICRAALGAELLVFDDEGHGIVKHGNRAKAYGRALAFVKERLDV